MTVPNRSTLSIADLRELAPAMGVSVPTDIFRDEALPEGVRRESRHLRMKDQTRVAIDVWLPPTANPIPTVIRSTRYWRARVGDAITEHMNSLEIGRWISSGFALVLVDARGTGASFGQWLRPLDDLQRSDLSEVVDWVIAQSWSDGSVVGQGVSYDGATTQLLLSTGHPAVKAGAPLFTAYDVWAEAGAPGGVPLEWFLETWSNLAWTLDGHPQRRTHDLPLEIVGSVRPVDDDVDGSLIAAAVDEHSENWDLWAARRSADFRSQSRGADGEDADAGGPSGRAEQLREAAVPTWLWSSWFDAAFAAGQLVQLLDDRLDVRVTIGAFSHGAAHALMGDPFLPALELTPSPPQLQAQLAQFMSHHVGLPVTDPSPRRLRFWTLGKGWRDSGSWPPEGLTDLQLALRSDGLLAVEPEQESLCREYEVDFEATTGTSTRWHTLIGGGPVVYADRAEADRRLLVWDGPPLTSEIEISCSPVLSLDVACSTTDAAIHVYLEAVAPDGRVVYLTEGQLRLLHRRLGSPPYAALGPWHSCLEGDAAPMTPNQQESVHITLWPISAAVPAGYRLRVALAGTDKGIFRRIPEQGSVTLLVAGTSSLTLQVHQPSPVES